MPIWRRGQLGPRERIDILEEYMLLTAWFRGEIAKELNDTLEVLDEVEDAYDAIDITWTIEGKPRTDKGVAAAKFEANQEVAHERNGLTKRVQRLKAEMDRLDREATICSRAYTLITGT